MDEPGLRSRRDALLVRLCEAGAVEIRNTARASSLPQQSDFITYALGDVVIDVPFIEADKEALVVSMLLEAEQDVAALVEQQEGPA